MIEQTEMVQKPVDTSAASGLIEQTEMVKKTVESVLINRMWNTFVVLPFNMLLAASCTTQLLVSLRTKFVQEQNHDGQHNVE